MGTPTPSLDEYEIHSVKRMDSTDGSKPKWVNITYVKKSLILTAKNGTSTTASTYKLRL